MKTYNLCGVTSQVNRSQQTGDLQGQYQFPCQHYLKKH